MKDFRRVDIHAHLNTSDFEADKDEVAKRALNDGTAIINVGTNLETSRAAVQIARSYEEGVYAIVGLHPTEAGADFDLATGFDVAAFRELLKDPKVVGVGECGLDYFHSGEKAKQAELFRAQISLAAEFNKPLMLHIRDAYGDALNILREYPGVRGNVHFFAGTIAEAQQFLDIGFTVSFTGVITFPNTAKSSAQVSPQYVDLVKQLPLDMIQVETDCPYVAPVPYRGKRNEPMYVAEVTKKIAEIKGKSLEEVETQILANSRRVWGIL